MLRLIDDHIALFSDSGSIKEKPSLCFDHFCIQHRDTIVAELEYLYFAESDSNYSSNDEDLIRECLHKIKKTYKNRLRAR